MYLGRIIISRTRIERNCAAAEECLIGTSISQGEYYYSLVRLIKGKPYTTAKIHPECLHLVGDKVFRNYLSWKEKNQKPPGRPKTQLTEEQRILRKRYITSFNRHTKLAFEIIDDLGRKKQHFFKAFEYRVRLNNIEGNNRPPTNRYLPYFDDLRANYPQWVEEYSKLSPRPDELPIELPRGVNNSEQVSSQMEPGQDSGNSETL